jgi:hypothetical protein
MHDRLAERHRRLDVVDQADVRVSVDRDLRAESPIPLGQHLWLDITRPGFKDPLDLVADL